MRRLIVLMMAGLAACSSPEKKEVKSDGALFVTEQVIASTIDSLQNKFGNPQTELISRGVKHAASLWRGEDGTTADFTTFCVNNYISDENERALVFQKFSKNFESILGNYNRITLDLRENVDLDNGPLTEIDKMFSAYSISSHLSDDLYQNKIAFIVALNFPYYPLEEKEALGKNWSRTEWAYARLGDIFISREPAAQNQAFSVAGAEADIYISEYNIHMGKLRTDDGKQLFPDNMVLLSHWNLRDEIKANYGDKTAGPDKQEMVYQVMLRIVNQDIPQIVINNPNVEWKPYANQVFEGDKMIEAPAEPDNRYQQIINNFKAAKAIDAYNPELNTFIKRKFSGEMEIPQEQVEALFDQYLRSPQLAQIGKIIENRLGRKLRPYDIWYDGFKARSAIPQEKLNGLTTQQYPNPAAFEADMANMLVKLGWNKERANYLATKITVDPARGSGHAWGASMKGEKAHLRTRIAPTGMDYKGYNIAVHEFGHNVEQTISLYDVDNYSMNGVPNTAFTEALAFIFQSRDLYLLGFTQQDQQQETLNTLDSAWSLMEIMGVGMVDMKVWKWLYAHPEATATELKNAVTTIAKEVWNSYFAPVYGVNDQPLLAIYSHMISNPLYLANYSYGQIIEFQLEEHLQGKSFPNEIDRIFRQGRLIPQIWMEEATGNKLSVTPILNALDKALLTMNVK